MTSPVSPAPGRQDTRSDDDRLNSERPLGRESLLRRDLDDRDELLPPPPPPILSTALAVILAALSLLVFVTNYAVVLALAGLVAAAISLWHGRTGEGLVWTPRLATAAAAVCALMIGLTISHSLSRQIHVVGQATELADAWVDLLLEGQDEQAHQLMLPVEARIKAGQTFDEFYAPLGTITPEMSEQERDAVMGRNEAHPTSSLNSFRQEPAVTAVLGKRGQTQIERTGQTFFYPDQGLDTVVVRYRITALAEGRPIREMLADLSLSRRVRSDLGLATWKVDRFRKPETE